MSTNTSANVSSHSLLSPYPIHINNLYSKQVNQLEHPSLLTQNHDESADVTISFSQNKIDFTQQINKLREKNYFSNQLNPDPISHIHSVDLQNQTELDALNVKHKLISMDLPPQKENFLEERQLIRDKNPYSSNKNLSNNHSN